MNTEHAILESSIGYAFSDKSLVEPSLVHPSYRHENSGVTNDNQRLEFLGDAALDLVAAEHLYRAYESDEGTMTKMRSSLTCTESLASIARSIELGKHLQLGRGEKCSNGAERDSNLADALEAVIGAAFIDGGLDAVRHIFRKLFLPRLKLIQSLDSQNPKGLLQEICQKNGKGMPIYRILEEHGPAHDRTFSVAVIIDEVEIATGAASSKGRAERSAAVAAIDLMKARDDIDFQPEKEPLTT